MITFNQPFPPDRTIDFSVWDLVLLRQSMRQTCNILATKGVQDAIVDVLVRDAQLMNSIAERGSMGTSQFMPALVQHQDSSKRPGVCLRFGALKCIEPIPERNDAGGPEKGPA
jgi:hypothetical protein